MKIAMIGTRGVPAKYGGFETAVEEIGTRLVGHGHQVTVYCRNRGQDASFFMGMRLVNLPALRKRSLETLSHSLLSVLHAVRYRPDAAILFNAGNAPLIPVLKAARIPTAIHMDGLEWKRAKWAGLGARYYKWAEGYAARSGFALIADAHGIAEHIAEHYSRRAYTIPYGAPILSPPADKLSELGLESGGFHLVVARMEPENHVDMIVEGYRRSGSTLPLIVVGSTPYGDTYPRRVRSFSGQADVRFIGSVWDQDLLNALYGHARSYLHGHSVGGTNPSLLRALGSGAPVTAYRVNFNIEVTASHALFFETADEVARAVQTDDRDLQAARRRGSQGQLHAASRYRWDEVAVQYSQMLKEIAAGISRSSRG